MLIFDAEILKYASKGEKSGWSYIEIPRVLADKIKPNYRRSYRVKGKIDQEEVCGMALTPIGEGHFILALRGSFRKQLHKEEGAVLHLQLEEDTDFKIELPEDLEICLCEQEVWFNRFMSLAKSHRNYFIK